MAATVDLKTFLKTLPGFEGFAGAHLDALAGAMKVQLYPKGHTFIWQGEQGQALYMIMELSIIHSPRSVLIYMLFAYVTVTEL